MLVKTYLALDVRGEIGCFAGEPIDKGQKVWTRNSSVDKLFRLEDIPLLSPELRAEIEKFGYPCTLPGDNTEYVELNMDHGRYMNHSETPNVIEINEDNFAAHAIEQGVELTCDYRKFDPKMDLCGKFLKDIS